MSRINRVGKKETLELKKKQLLEELKYYERQVEEAKRSNANHVVYEESSDSDTEISIPLNVEPSVASLKIEHSALQTCLHATQELTGLQVLQSEVNVMVEEPKLEGEQPVTEDGVWREIIIECRVDLVPFSMNFYVHKPNRRFGPLSYRGLKVTPLKRPHEAELEKSILQELTRPSDAFEVLKTYSSAHRSRRCTLADLASSFFSSLRMAPLSDGGYQLKCGNLMEISWTLQNKTSPVAPFHHRLKFDLEYMDEGNIQTIMAAHKALSDPLIDTDTRTSLLSKIITVCLEVQGINLQESTSESESYKNQPAKRKREDNESMAPPKAPPKKSRPKGKENKSENRTVRAVRDENNRDNERHNVRNSGNTNICTDVSNDRSFVAGVSSVKNDAGKHKDVENNLNNKQIENTKGIESLKNVVHKAKVGKSSEFPASKAKEADTVKKVYKEKVSQNKIKSIEEKSTAINKGKEINYEIKSVEQKTTKNNQQRSNVTKLVEQRINDVDKIQGANSIKPAKQKNAETIKEKETNKKIKSVEQITIDSTIEKGTNNKLNSAEHKTNIVNTEQVAKKTKTIEQETTGVKEKVTNKAKSAEQRVNTEKSANNKIKTVEQRTSEVVKMPPVKKNKSNKDNRVGNIKMINNVTDNKNTNNTNKPNDKESKTNHENYKTNKQINNKDDEKLNNETQKKSDINKDLNKPKVSTKVNNIVEDNLNRTFTKTSSGSANFKPKLLKNKFSDRKISNVLMQKNTRIPQKAPSSLEKIMKKNPLRMSPRHSGTKFAGMQNVRKPLTHIPRLVSKPLKKF